MLGDVQIDLLDVHLENFKANTQRNQQSLQVLLKDYSQLLEDYKSLKKSHETNNLNNDDSGSTDTARQPYVLVLVDGNGYMFNDELIKDKEEGGMRAARMLNEAVDKYVRESLPGAKHHRVIVRIYADITGLSKLLGKSKLVGLEKRSLADFTAGFTRSINFFDFTDALDEEGTKFKIREMFKFGAEDIACSHILFAGCHDNSYLPQLVPFSGLRNKITLVQGAGFSPEFHQFSLNITHFPTVFRWSELPPAPGVKSSNSLSHVATQVKANKAARGQTYNLPVHRNEDPWKARNGFGAGSSSGADQPFKAASNGFAESNGTISWGAKNESHQEVAAASCRYFQKGFCRSGITCKFHHAPRNPNTNASVNHNSNDAQAPQWISIDRSAVSTTLPTSEISGFIPLNKDAQRLDVFVKPPTQDEWNQYSKRFHRRKPCNSYHLLQLCTAFDCPYDHSELEPAVRRTLEYMVKGSPCPKKSACRSAYCQYGHLCQKDDCTGHNKGCRMKPEMHAVDPKLASMIPAEQEELVHDGTESAKSLGGGVGW